MKLDPKELTHVAAAEAPRFDMYCGIHKALRALMADTLLAVGRMDVEDGLEGAQVTQRVLELLDSCGAHLNHENEFVHAAIEARAPGASEVIAHEHDEHMKQIAGLSRLVGELRAGDPVHRPRLALRLYRELSLFVAENFQHMHIDAGVGEADAGAGDGAGAGVGGGLTNMRHPRLRALLSGNRSHLSAAVPVRLDVIPAEAGIQGSPSSSVAPAWASRSSHWCD